MIKLCQFRLLLSHSHLWVVPLTPPRVVGASESVIIIDGWAVLSDVTTNTISTLNQFTEASLDITLDRLLGNSIDIQYICFWGRRCIYKYNISFLDKWQFGISLLTVLCVGKDSVSFLKEVAIFIRDCITSHKIYYTGIPHSLKFTSKT